MGHIPWSVPGRERERKDREKEEDREKEKDREIIGRGIKSEPRFLNCTKIGFAVTVATLYSIPGEAIRWGTL